MSGGPSGSGAFIGRARRLVELGVAALVLSSCGGGDEAAPPRQGEPPAQLHSRPGGGDEEPILVRVGVRVTRDAVAVEPGRVAAFLPLRIGVDNDAGRRVAVRVRGVGRVVAPAGSGDRSLRSPGLEPGRYRVRAAGGTAVLRVTPGG
jgi:hypothetical protein